MNMETVAWAQRFGMKLFLVLRKKTKLRELISCVKVIKDEMTVKSSKLTIKKLHLLVRYKQTKKDVAIPSTKADLLAR